MISSGAIERAIATGRRQAEAIIEFRNRELVKRAAAIAGAPKLMRRESMFTPKMDAVRALGPQARDVLIAEGDSWFDYPLHDVLRLLEDHHGYDVESVAHKGDRVEEMAYADGQLEEFTRRIEKLLRWASVPRAILLSGGGNDVAGEEFGMLLNHASSAIAGLNDSVVEGVINERAKTAYITIISRVTSICEQRIGRLLPIVIHGYDYPVPDGRGFLGGWGMLPGPWLEPGFREKGYAQMEDRIRLTRDLIDRFNAMLEVVAALPSFGHVNYLNLRGTLSAAGDYKEDWANELHPTAEGFEKVTAKFATLLAGLA